MTFDPGEAYVELAEKKRDVRKARRAFAKSTDGAFVRAMREAMGEFERMRSEGVSREDACRGIEAVLREVWPHRPSKFAPRCGECADTGYREMVCWDQQRCGREVCAMNPEKQHAYVVPCECPAGDRIRPKFRTSDDDLAAVGRTMKRKPRGFSRLGQ
jgi:hypothetical protein